MVVFIKNRAKIVCQSRQIVTVERREIKNLLTAFASNSCFSLGAFWCKALI